VQQHGQQLQHLLQLLEQQWRRHRLLLLQLQGCC
jgi:hypothetical protein